MNRTWRDGLRWMREGQALFARALDGLDETGFSAACALPGWNRRHLVGHVAGNAAALTNLVTWTETGVETPMYASPDARAGDIARAADMTGPELCIRLAETAARLEAGLDGLSTEQWGREVRTVQGRLLPATEIPWLRAREVMVHAVDLGRGVTFASLPQDFLEALIADISAFRGGVTPPPGPVPEVAAWLAGRDHALDDAPALGPWL